MALNFTKEPKFEVFQIPKSIQIADAMRKHDMSKLLSEWGGEQADVTAEYVKLDDEFKSLQVKYDDLSDSVGELKREIVRLQVIVTYLEGKK
jgi:uncharacterized protein YlxW (UPF0749 family)